MDYRAWGIPAVLSRGIPGNALRAFPGSFRNFSGICSGKSQLRLGRFLWNFVENPSILEADDFLGACCRKAMTPKKLRTLPSCPLDCPLLAFPFCRLRPPSPPAIFNSGRKKQPKHKVFGRDIPGTSGTKTLCKWSFSVVLDMEWWVGTSRIWKNFMQENFELIFRSLVQ